MDPEWPALLRHKATKFLEGRGLIHGLDFWWDDGLRVPGPASAKLVGLMLSEFNAARPVRCKEGGRGVAQPPLKKRDAGSVLVVRKPATSHSPIP